MENREDPETIQDFYNELEKLMITEKINLDKMKEPLLFWAHDDTVEPQKSYRYKIRYGVFSPVAGTNQFSEGYEDLKNRVVLWSDFSDVTETFAIPKRLYIFPTDLQEAAEKVTVQLSKYKLGHWYSNIFNVSLGEDIGQIVEYEGTDDELEKDVTVPDKIDYSTGAVLVDVRGPVKEWSGTSPDYYHEMLYSFDGSNIERLAIETKHLPFELRSKYYEINKAEKEPKEPLRSWSGRATRSVGIKRSVPLLKGGPDRYQKPRGDSGFIDRYE